MTSVLEVTDLSMVSLLFFSSKPLSSCFLRYSLVFSLSFLSLGLNGTIVVLLRLSQTFLYFSCNFTSWMFIFLDIKKLLLLAILNSNVHSIFTRWNRKFIQCYPLPYVLKSCSFTVLIFKKLIFTFYAVFSSLN